VLSSFGTLSTGSNGEHGRAGAGRVVKAAAAEELFPEKVSGPGQIEEHCRN
jgi:hypothetical protein